MRTPRPLAAALAAVAAALVIAASPGTAAADPVDGLDCTVQDVMFVAGESHTCVADSEDIRWQLQGRCYSTFAVFAVLVPVSSPVVEGSGTATLHCHMQPRTSGPITLVSRVVL